MSEQNFQNAKAPVGLIIILVVIVIIAIKSCSPFKRDLEWSVPLDRDDAFTIASVILGQGKVRGCGDLVVTHVYALSKEVSVKCGSGRSYGLTWYPVFKIDGKTPDDLVWDRPRLEGLYCVKDETGKWQAAYIESDKVIAYATAQSAKTGTSTRIYRSDSTIYGETIKNDDGSWRAILSLDHLEDPDERRGCELSATDDR